MSCNAGVGDKARLAQGHYSSRVLAPTGGGKTTISLGGGYGNQPPRTQNQRGVKGVRGGGGGRNNMPSQVQGRGMPLGRGRGTGGVRRVPQTNPSGAGRGRGAAGGSAALSNAGGYGNLDVHSKASSRVLNQPGGGSSNIFGAGGNQNQKRANIGMRKGTVQPSRGRGRAAGGSAALSNAGGYGNLDIHSKASSRVLAPPGGGSSGIFGSSTDNRKTKLNQSQMRAKSSLQSNVFGAPTQSKSKGAQRVAQPRVKNGPAQPSRGRGAAGGSGALSNTGGYGNLDIHSKPSSRVRAQPGGGSSQPGGIF